MLGPGDLIELRVYPDQSLDGRFRIHPRGEIEMPLLGPVAVSGLTVSETADRLQQGLEGRFYRNPRVEVEVVEHVAHRISVLGAVKNPGVYPVAGGDRILDAIERAGGLSGEVAGMAYVLPDEEAAAVTRVSLRGLLEGGSRGENLRLGSGETIYVVPSAKVYVLGEVEAPGSYAFVEEMTLLRVISAAGGFSDRARKGRVVVYSGPGRERDVIDVDDVLDQDADDLFLRPGDLVVVPRRFF